MLERHHGFPIRELVSRKEKLNFYAWIGYGKTYLHTNHHYLFFTLLSFKKSKCALDNSKINKQTNPSPGKLTTHIAIMRLLRYFHFFLLHRKAYLLIFAKKAVCSATKWSTYFFIFRANRNLQMCIKINIDKDRSLDKCEFIKCM